MALLVSRGQARPGNWLGVSARRQVGDSIELLAETARLQAVFALLLMLALIV